MCPLHFQLSKIEIQSYQNNEMRKNAQQVMNTPIGYHVVSQNVYQVRRESVQNERAGTQYQEGGVEPEHRHLMDMQRWKVAYQNIEIPERVADQKGGINYIHI